MRETMRTTQPIARALSLLLACGLVGACAATPGASATSAAQATAVTTPAAATTSRPSVSPTTAADHSPTESSAPVPGGRLAYDRYSPDGNSHVFTANTDGTDEQALLTSVGGCSRFSPDGRRLEVAAQTSQGLLFFDLVNPDGSGSVRLDSPDRTLTLGCAVWSPDASRLASEGWDDSKPARNGIYTVRASDGGGLIRVTTSPGGGHDVPGDYSPDGRQIVFLRDNLVDEEHNALMVVNADGSDPRVLTDRKVGLACRWSPDGKMILTESGRSLLLVPASGGQPIPIRGLDAGSAVKATRGGWSPDGAWIVFSRVTSTGEDIWVMRKDGTDLHQITHTPGVDEEGGEWGVPAP